MSAPDERNPLHRRHSSTQHYQTFDTPPPKSRGRPNSGQSGTSADGTHQNDSSSHSSLQSPLPKKQMAVLAMIALCEQTALNSISPYLPSMAASFPGIKGNEVGAYVGTIASAFALAQFVTNYFWGWLSDRTGRKPVILLGTILTAACFVAFGFCRTLWQAVFVQALMGVVNGNQGLVSACLGEITDRSNQSRAFTYLPVLYGIGGITGPLLGGLLVFQKVPFSDGDPNPFPYLAPNLLSAVILVVDFVLTAFLLEESLEDADSLPKFERKVRSLFSWLWQFTSPASRPSYVHRATSSGYRPLRYIAADNQDHDSELDSASEASGEGGGQHMEFTWTEMFNRDTILLLLTYLIFALCNVSFNSLFPIFGQAPPPIGRSLTPSEIGLSQGFAGIVTIVFQICLFGKLRDKMGNRWSYRAGLFGFVVSFLFMPFVGYKGRDAENGLTARSALMAFELCFVLLVKTIAAVGGLTSALLLVTNSAPNHAALGALNGLAQTLSAAGRAVGPFLSGGLFSLATRIPSSGAFMAFGVFAAVSFVGFVLSFGIRGRSLEADGDPDDAAYKSDDDDEPDP